MEITDTPDPENFCGMSVEMLLVEILALTYPHNVPFFLETVRNIEACYSDERSA